MLTVNWNCYHYYQKISKVPGGACAMAQWHNGQSKPVSHVPIPSGGASSVSQIVWSSAFAHIIWPTVTAYTGNTVEMTIHDVTAAWYTRCTQNATFWQPCTIYMAVLYYTQKTGFSAAILPNVNWSGWNFARICCCTCEFDLTRMVARRFQANP